MNVKLPHLDRWHKQRQANATAYETYFAESGLSGTKVHLPKAVYKDSGVQNYHIYNQFIIRVEGDRDALRAHLSDAGVANEIYYPVSFHEQECFAELGYQTGDFPEAEKAQSSTIAVPVYPELEDEQIAYVVKQFERFYN